MKESLDKITGYTCLCFSAITGFGATHEVYNLITSIQSQGLDALTNGSTLGNELPTLAFSLTAGILARLGYKYLVKR